MPAYHSSFNDNTQYRQIGNIALLPIKTKIRGPAPPAADPQADDIVDEAIALFRANCFFRNFEIKGNGDRVLIYLLLFIQECLGKLQKNPSATEGQRTLLTHALQNFAVPGEPQFPLNAMYEKPGSRADIDNLKQYLSQLRQETVTRLLPKVYDGDRPSKWWMCFSKRKFMGLPNIGTLA
ncbi:actin-related protein 2/3 complex subunit 3 [Fimicolochytrium jonesii]|uniref:actin-related protein 2/3 complex subunit 3 n=1 Tax=Fimicolochytrium jonesii TaxID=1396493 RepID=UPI0022FE8D14|nr:actin-related protein 2/3 complex subunit 3 [Fimicolochytrium jonesii]KAI8816457.1 actin-related protein 2/3 complex subunit 3 [Fimicolochytrium jonesii]